MHMLGDVVRKSSRCLVLGCGSIGQRHIRNLLALKAGDVFAFDLLKERRQAVAAELGIKVIGHLEEAWDLKPQIALITAPTNAHVPLALRAAEHRCHIFVEKPLSHTFDNVDRLCTEIDHRQLVSMVGCNMRFHPGPVTVKKMLEEAVVGKVIAARIHTGSYLPNWRPWEDYRQSYSASPEWGGAILDCIHEIDLALWFFGPAKVMAAVHLPAVTIGLETDGLAEVILQHESGALSSVHLNFVQRDYRRTCQVIGTEGTIYWDFADRRVRVYGKDGEVQETYPEPGGWQINQMYLDELDHFLGAVESGSPTVNPIAQSLAALEVALAARSAKVKEH